MIDYRAVFSRVVFEEMGRIFGEHGIDEIREEDFEDIVAECTQKCFWPSIRELRDKYGLSVVPKMGYSASSWMWNRR